jgi:glycine betaine catabolism B
MRIQLKARLPETTDVMSFVFDLGGQKFEFRPGQFVFYELDGLVFPDERGNRRHFTISSSPTEKGTIMFTTKMRGTGFKETLLNAPLGYELNVETPDGLFVMHEGEARRQVFITGGIGVTPFRSILRNAVDTNAPISGLMLYFNHASSDIIFRDELENISRQMQTFSMVHVLSQPEERWTGERGQLDEMLLRKYVTNFDQSVFWISGPPQMVSAYRGLIKQIGVSDEAIRTDSFIGY